MLVIKYYWGHQIKKTEVGGACGMYGGEERCIMGLGVKHEGENPLGRCEDNTKMDLEEVRLAGMDWINLLRIETGGGLL